MKVTVHIGLKPGVLDPQGKAIANSLHDLGYKNVKGARQGKIIELDLKETNAKKATQQVSEMCERLLANTVIESYHISVGDKA